VETSETFVRTTYVDGEQEEASVADYWDALTGAMTRTTPGLTGTYKFNCPMDEKCFGTISADHSDYSKVLIDIQVDPDSKDINTEYWMLDFSGLGDDTVLG
jgi:hypothetical protein